MTAAIVLGLIGLRLIIGYYTNIARFKDKDSDDGWIAMFIIVSILIAAFSMHCISKEADYAVSNERVQLTWNWAQQLTDELRTEVAQYLKHENATLKSLSPSNADILLIRYPELKSVETVTTLLKKISEARTGVYKAQMDRLDIRATLMFHSKSPLTPWTPDLGQDPIAAKQ